MTQHSKDVAMRWDTLADRYDEIVKTAKSFSPDWIARHAHDIDDLPECRVLDLACGTGLNVKALSERRSGIRADGVDISSKMIEHARATGKYESFCKHNLNHPLLELPATTYDLVIAFHFLQFLSDAFVCISECHRLLKVNGILWASFKRYEAEDPASPPRQISTGDSTVTGYSAGEILHMMSNLNMRVIAVESLVGHLSQNGFGIPYLVVEARKTQ